VQRERNRISRDLHDNVGSQVSTILAGIELIQLSAGDTERVDGYLAALRSDAERTMAELRDTVWSLHHDQVTLRGLLERIEDHLVARRRYLVRPVLSLAAQGPLDRVISSAQALHLFRVVQEGVNNAIRHSGASTVTVEMNAETEMVRLTIGDDGVFQAPADGHGGVGIEGMRFRAAEVGGTFALRAGAFGGTVVQVSVPLARDRN
jgi:signal transduction histidine kinase